MESIRRGGGGIVAGIFRNMFPGMYTVYYGGEEANLISDEVEYIWNLFYRNLRKEDMSKIVDNSMKHNMRLNTVYGTIRECTGLGRNVRVDEE